MRAAHAAPPPVLGLAAHPLRWRLLAELAHGDHRVRELTHLVGGRQSLVSYHLGRLRTAGLVTMRRSSADGRDAYYRLELARFATDLAGAGDALHPGVALAPREATAMRPPSTRLLFVCTGNSARSQMAEALAEHHGRGRVRAWSAGITPRPLHPEAVRAMGARGIDIGGRPSKAIGTVARRRFDAVVSLCDRAREVCPELPGPPDTIHWSIPDPAREPDPRQAFAACADELDARIRFLITGLTP